MWIVGSLLVGAVAIGLLWSALGSRATSTASTVVHLEVGLAPAEELLGSDPMDILRGSRRPSRTALALSPDGKYLVFAGARAGVQQLYLRAFDRDEATPIANTEGGDNPFLSPDGRWVGFWARGALKKVPLDGGPAVEICPTPHVRGVSWGANDVIVFASDLLQGLQQVPAGGGKPEAVTTLDRQAGETGHFLPFLLPGGRGVLFSVNYSGGVRKTSVAVQPLDGGARTTLIEDAADARYLPSGYLVFVRSGALMAAPFDPVRLKLTSSPVPILDGVMQAMHAPTGNMNTYAGQYAFSSNGHLAYVTGGIFRDFESTLVWTNRTGHQQPLAAPPAPYQSVALFPDGERVVGYTISQTRQLWIWHVPQGPLSRIPFEGPVRNPLPTPNGNEVVFSGTTNGPYNLWLTRSDGGGTAERLTTSAFYQAPQSWSPLGRELIFMESVHPDTGSDIWALSMQDRSVRPLLHSQFNENYAALSPDGRWLAYTSDASGRNEVYVQPYPNLEHQIPISTDGGDSPRWTRGGRELIYRVPIGEDLVRLMSVDVSASDDFKKSAVPRRLFDLPISKFDTLEVAACFDVTRDGQRILNRTRENKTPPPPKEIRVTLNWFDEVRAKVGGGQ